MYLCEDPLTWAIRTLHRHIIPFWNRDDPQMKHLTRSFKLTVWHGDKDGLDENSSFRFRPEGNRK